MSKTGLNRKQIYTGKAGNLTQQKSVISFSTLYNIYSMIKSILKTIYTVIINLSLMHMVEEDLSV